MWVIVYKFVLIPSISAMKQTPRIECTALWHSLQEWEVSNLLTISCGSETCFGFTPVCFDQPVSTSPSVHDVTKSTAVLYVYKLVDFDSYHENMKFDGFIHGCSWRHGLETYWWKGTGVNGALPVLLKRNNEGAVVCIIITKLH